MLITVDRHNGVPAYRQVMDQIRFHVASGALAGGDEVPSTRALAAEIEINPMTVSKAYSLLEAEGVLERRPGMPLVIKQTGQHGRKAHRHEQLERCLAPAARKARQLGAPAEEALALFEQLLTQDEPIVEGE
jgi:GntR family transcriptional regulator